MTTTRQWDRCSNIVVNGQKIHIPGCIGCASLPNPGGRHNPNACTCHHESRKLTESDRIDKLEAKLARLETIVRRLASGGPR